MSRERDPDLDIPVRDAYKRAWKRRDAEGDSDQLLREEFEAVGFDPDPDSLELWMGTWNAGVRPNRVARHFTKLMWNELVSSGREIREIINDPELPDWLLPPEGHAMLSVGWVSGDVKKRKLEFRPDVPPPSVLDRCRNELKVKKDGSRKVRVWLQLGKDPAETPVMVGLERIGMTSVTPSQARKMRPKPWTKKNKVPDGNLRVSFDAEGKAVFGTLKVHLPGTPKS